MSKRVSWAGIGLLLMCAAAPASAQVCKGGQTCAEKGCKGPCVEETNPDGTCTATCIQGLVPEASATQSNPSMSIYGLDKDQRRKIRDFLESR